jgi:dihydrofolate synthase/folylpolyglutamate synthase
LTYREALDVLRRRGNEVQAIHLGLQRIEAVMRAMGDPHHRFPSLHIAGTNGKGSVAAMSESILRHAGYKTGLYTSPHLVRIEERIRVGGADISEQALAERVANVTKVEASLRRRRTLDRRLTWFELVTAGALLHFAAEKVEIAVIEVGLGGRHDATNIIRPLACAITGISYDHEELLGKTLSRIATEKAGIIKEGIPVVIGHQAAAAHRVLVRAAHEVRAPLVDAQRDCRVLIVGQERGRCVFDLDTRQRHYSGLRLALAGRHQTRNASLAVSAVEALGLPVKLTDVRRGLRNTRWPGRLDEYAARRRTLLDGAHNAEGATILRDFLRQLDEPCIHLVFGALRDKDIARMGRVLFPLAATIHLTRIGNSRSAEPSEIAALHTRYLSRMRLYQNSTGALKGAWSECPPEGSVVVAGSLYLVGELLPIVRADTIRG